MCVFVHCLLSEDLVTNLVVIDMLYVLTHTPNDRYKGNTNMNTSWIFQGPLCAHWSVHHCTSVWVACLAALLKDTSVVHPSMC